MRHGEERGARKRKYCNKEGCSNLVVQGGVCKQHGASVICNQDGCNNHVQQGGVCVQHGARVKRCNKDGCSKQSYKAEPVFSMGREYRNANAVESFDIDNTLVKPDLYIPLAQ